MSDKRVPIVLGTPENPIISVPHPDDPYRFTIQGLSGNNWTEHLQSQMDTGNFKRKRLGE